MEDSMLIELFFHRDEKALLETSNTYGRYCESIAFNILHDDGDAQECLNDTLLRAWNSIPPQRPASLKAYLGRIARNLSIDCYNRRTSQKRGGGQIDAVFDELTEIVGASDVGISENSFTEMLNRYLSALPVIKRNVFVRRYFYMDSVRDISKAYVLSEGNVKTMLCRMREELKGILQKEGVEI